MTNQELVDKKEKAQKILNIWKMENTIPDVSVIVIEALEAYIDNLDNTLQVLSENVHND